MFSDQREQCLVVLMVVRHEDQINAVCSFKKDFTGVASPGSMTIQHPLFLINQCPDVVVSLEGGNRMNGNHG